MPWEIMCFGFFVYLTQLLRVHYILLLSFFFLLFFLSPFIILFVFALLHTFSYVTLFTINTSVITLQKKKNPIPGTHALRISSRLSIACSQALLWLAFFHRLPHLWFSTVLLKVHHFISLHFSLLLRTSLLLRFCHNPHVTLWVTSTLSQASPRTLLLATL